MKTLALDCSQNSVCLALTDGEQLIGGLKQHADKPHSALLLKTLDDFLREQNVQLEDIRRVLYFHGPGSFTSLRIGLATLLGLFLKRDEVQYVEASSLLLRCLSVQKQSPQNLEVWMRAGRDRIYRGRLSQQGEFHEDALSLAQALDRAHTQRWAQLLAGDGLSLLSEAEHALLAPHYEQVLAQDVADPQGCLAVLNQAKFTQPPSLQAAKLNYLMEPDIG